LSSRPDNKKTNSFQVVNHITRLLQHAQESDRKNFNSFVATSRHQPCIANSKRE
jgi:hypothetical protein